MNITLKQTISDYFDAVYPLWPLEKRSTRLWGKLHKLTCYNTDISKPWSWKRRENVIISSSSIHTETKRYSKGKWAIWNILPNSRRMTVSCIASRAPRRESLNCITIKSYRERHKAWEHSNFVGDNVIRWWGPYPHAGHFRLNHKETSKAQTNTRFDLVLQDPNFGSYEKQQHKQELGIQGFARWRCFQERLGELAPMHCTEIQDQLLEVGDGNLVVMAGPSGAILSTTSPKKKLFRNPKSRIANS